MSITTKKDLLHKVETEGTIQCQHYLSTYLTEQLNGWNYSDGYSYRRKYDKDDIKARETLISLYKELFDWDESYSVHLEFEIVPATAYANVDCKDKKELIDYLNFVKEEPDGYEDWVEGKDYDLESMSEEIDHETSRKGCVCVSNLKLKKEAK